MPIEFECPSCLAVLRVGAEHASASLACPACRGRIVVPDESPAVEFDLPPEPVPNWSKFGEIVVCDLCGSRNVPEDPDCRNCGEQLATSLPPVVEEKSPSLVSGPPFTIDEVVSTSWQLYRREFGPYLLGSIVSWFAWIAGLIGGCIPVFLMAALFRIGVVRQPFVLIFPFLAFVVVLITAYSQIGFMIYVENVIRRGQGDLGLLFHGSRFILRMLVLYFVYWTMVFVGSIAFVIPGLVVHSMFWAAPFILVEEDCGVFQALDRSRRLTQGHRGTLFLVSCVEGLVWVMGAALALGTFAASPISKVLVTVTYLRLTGREAGPSEDGMYDDEDTDYEDPEPVTDASDVLEPLV